MDKNFYIGLDIGTDSVGWAVTDENYNLLKARGQDMWGSYLYEEAQTAATRRVQRTTRRRYARRRERLNLLQSLFAEEISKIDPTFFLRLNNSFLFVEDKDAELSSANVLFDDAEYKDKDFFTQYPTIYHLRSELTKTAADDIRKLYIAVHHIIKNRGHFLFEGQSFDANNTESIKEVFYELNAFLSDNEMSEMTLSDLDKVLSVLRDKKLRKKDKCNQLDKMLCEGKNKQISSIVKAMTGYNVNIKELYNADDNFDEIKKFSFEDATFEETLPKIESAVGVDNIKMVLDLKKIYDWSMLSSMLNGKEYISDAKKEIYEKHKNDLKRLKDYLRSNRSADEYKKVVRHFEGVDNYAAYVGMDRQKGYKKCKQEDFYAFLKKEIKISDESILQEIEDGSFLPKQVSGANGIIPYQLHLRELDAILKNAKDRFPFLTKEEDGATVMDKIKSLLTFRIPYYVGPLNNKSQFAWSVRKEGQGRTKVTPWNFDQVIDRDASEQEFIRRMTNKCTYLVGEDVLPAKSLLYSEFTFLNELNNLRINGEKDDRARKIIYDYAKLHRKITLKNILKLLVSEGLLPAGSKADEVFSGTDGDFTTSLAPWVDLQFLGNRLETHREMCEEIILWHTLISDKSRLENRIRQKYGDLLSNEEIKLLKGLNYSQWGRLSGKLLDGIANPQCVDENGQPMTIIAAMRATGENFMQLLSDKYGFKKIIDEYNDAYSSDGKITYSTVKDLYCSPSVKRSIWRSIELVREIVDIYGVPKKIFVETAREVKDASRKGKRTVSRKQQLLDLYKNIKDNQREWIDEIEKTPDMKFDSDKLFLYYQQMGISAYSGEKIELPDVFNVNICDIDHIYPRSKIKDDSLDNRVLVFKTENNKKEDKYPVDVDIRKKMTPLWTEWKAKGLISEKKYARLTRTNPLSQEELADFINRQLVYTRQSTKAVIELLQKMLPDTKVVYSKAGNANEFKQENEIIKIRELNDLHHAKDAYINIVVGNVYSTKFNYNAEAYFKQSGLDSYNLKYLYNSDIRGAWKVSDKKRILSIVAKNTCRVVRMTERGKGELFNATIKPANGGSKLISLKERGAVADTNKYGGYDSATTAYFMLVKSKGKKGKPLLSLEAYPLMYETRFTDNEEAKLRFCEDIGLISPEIIIDELKINTLICIDGSYAYLRGKSNNNLLLCNANQLYLEECDMKTLKKVTTFINSCKKLSKPDLQKINIKKEDEEQFDKNLLTLYDTLLDKLSSPVYSGLSVKGQHPFLMEKRSVFEKLSREQKSRVLVEVLHLMQCNSVISNFTLLDGSKYAGSISTNKFIQDKNVKIILQSPTGYYRKVISIGQFL